MRNSILLLLNKYTKQISLLTVQILKTPCLLKTWAKKKIPFVRRILTVEPIETHSYTLDVFTFFCTAYLLQYASSAFVLSDAHLKRLVFGNQKVYQFAEAAL